MSARMCAGGQAGNPACMYVHMLACVRAWCLRARCLSGRGTALTSRPSDLGLASAAGALRASTPAAARTARAATASPTRTCTRGSSATTAWRGRVLVAGGGGGAGRGAGQGERVDGGVVWYVGWCGNIIGEGACVPSYVSWKRSKHQ